MHHDHQLQLHRQRADALHREAALMRMGRATARNRRRVRGTRAYGVVARRVWALRGVPNLIP